MIPGNWFLSLVSGVSAVLMVVASAMVLLYARDFYMDTPWEWYVIPAGIGLVGLSAFAGYAFMDTGYTTLLAIVQLIGAVLTLAGFGMAYERSTGGI